MRVISPARRAVSSRPVGPLAGSVAQQITAPQLSGASRTIPVRHTGHAALPHWQAIEVRCLPLHGRPHDARRG